jgi:transcriptional regulator with XRE-family HTH domain
MTDLREILAQNIKKYRRIRGFSQELLAEKAETSTTHIGMIEIGKKFPSPRMLEQIAGALGIDTPELFATGAVIFVPAHDKSMNRLYQDIMDDFEDFKKKVEGRIKEYQRC